MFLLLPIKWAISFRRCRFDDCILFHVIRGVLMEHLSHCDMLRAMKARRALDAQSRKTWPFPPAQRKVESQKRYNRNQNHRLSWWFE